MDDNIGNILYIIITLVALSLGLFGKRKKKPAQGDPSGGEASSQPGFLENLERALNNLGREDPEVVSLRRDEEDLEVEGVEPEMQPEMGSALAREEAEYDPFREYLAAKEREANERNSIYEELTHHETVMSDEMVPEMEESDKESLKVVELDREEGVDYFDVVKNFNLGTAVVYSTIINRLDY